MFGRLAMGFANVRAGTRVLIHTRNECRIEQRLLKNYNYSVKQKRRHPYAAYTPCVTTVLRKQSESLHTVVNLSS